MAVAVVEDIEAAQRVATWAGADADMVELRLDRLGVSGGEAENLISPWPWIATARDPAEGGATGTDERERRAKLAAAIGRAAAIDIELRNVATYGSLAREVRSGGSKLLVSAHDFQSCPSADTALSMRADAIAAGADIFKLAVTPRRAGEIGALLALLDDPPIPVALMAMGPLGMASRLLCAAGGSVLNYGWVTRPAVPGQWEARELKTLISRLTESAESGR